MRQFFSPRFWFTLAALVGLALVAFLVARDQQPDAAGTAPDATSTSRHIDLITWVYGVLPDDGFAMVRGRTTADIAIAVDGARTMVIKRGTPGQITCERLTEIGQCTVAADLLGDAVLWFSIMAGPPSATVQLPAVREILDGGWALLANGWQVPHADVIVRVCDDESTSLSEFIDTWGDTASSTFDIEQQRLVRVTCPRSSASTTTVTIPLPSTSIPIPSTSTPTP